MPEQALVAPPVRHARLDARPGSCWFVRILNEPM
jgi:hypothetical protein